MGRCVASASHVPVEKGGGGVAARQKASSPATSTSTMSCTYSVVYHSHASHASPIRVRSGSSSSATALWKGPGRLVGFLALSFPSSFSLPVALFGGVRSFLGVGKGASAA